MVATTAIIMVAMAIMKTAAVVATATLGHAMTREESESGPSFFITSNRQRESSLILLLMIPVTVEVDDVGSLMMKRRKRLSNYRKNNSGCSCNCSTSGNCSSGNNKQKGGSIKGRICQ